jgi:hypothetical protein
MGGSVECPMGSKAAKLLKKQEIINSNGIAGLQMDFKNLVI